MGKTCIGRCLPLFIFAFVFDVIGLIVLFVGIFANVRIKGRFYGDFLIYSGSLIIFSSLALWLMWFIGNIEVSSDDDFYSSMKKKSSFAQLARKLSQRLSKTIKGDDLRSKFTEVEDPVDQQVKLPPEKSSTVTWDKSDGCVNEGYDDNLDSPTPEKRKERPEIPNPDLNNTISDFSKDLGFSESPHSLIESEKTDGDQ